MIRPHLEYANSIWCPHLKRQSSSIERVQRRATRMIRECAGMSYEERLCFLDLHSLKGRRLRGDLIETYKIFNGQVDIIPEQIFKLAPTEITRNLEKKIFIEHAHTVKRQNTFKHRVAKHWNKLQVEIKKNAPSLNHFKNRLDKEKIFKSLFYDYDS